MHKRLMLSAVIFPMVNAVLFGFGAIAVLSFFQSSAALLLPITVVASFILALPLSWFVAPTLSIRLSHQLGLDGRDVNPDRSAILR
jgi:cation transporter-like permease